MLWLGVLGPNRHGTSRRGEHETAPLAARLEGQDAWKALIRQPLARGHDALLHLSRHPHRAAAWAT